MPIVAWLISAFTILLRSKFGYFLACALLWMGIGLTTYTVALQPTVDALIAFAGDLGTGGSSSSDIGVTALKWAGMMRLDQAITMWLSAIFTRHSVTSARLFLTKV